MRDWSYLDRHYEELIQDVYEQPIDITHFQWIQEMVERVAALPHCKVVLDVGAGQGDAQAEFEKHGMYYFGVSLGKDAKIARSHGKNVTSKDFNFLPWEDEVVDLVWSRHSLEHSPFPLLTLMEFHRISERWLCLILPNPEHFSYIGRNHYSVLPIQQAKWLLRRAGWKIMWKEYTEHELRFVCEKNPRIGYEGYANTPLSNKIYEADRDE